MQIVIVAPTVWKERPSCQNTGFKSPIYSRQCTTYVFVLNIALVAMASPLSKVENQGLYFINSMIIAFEGLWVNRLDNE